MPPDVVPDAVRHVSARRARDRLGVIRPPPRLDPVGKVEVGHPTSHFPVGQRSTAGTYLYPVSPVAPSSSCTREPGPAGHRRPQPAWRKPKAGPSRSPLPDRGANAPGGGHEAASCSHQAVPSAPTSLGAAHTVVDAAPHDPGAGQRAVTRRPRVRALTQGRSRRMVAASGDPAVAQPRSKPCHPPARVAAASHPSTGRRAIAEALARSSRGWPAGRLRTACQSPALSNAGHPMTARLPIRPAARTRPRPVA